MIYFIANEDRSRIKIGTTIDLGQRLKQLSAEYGELEVLAVIEGSFGEEKGLHSQFSHLRIVNEWFEPGDDLMGFIVTEGKPWSDDGSRRLLSVKMDADVVAEAKMVAASRDVSLAEYLTELVRPIVKKDLDREYAKRHPKKAKGGDPPT